MERYVIVIILMCLCQSGFALQMKECTRNNGPLPLESDVNCGEPCIMHPGQAYNMDFLFLNSM
jgi:hypothetical protein